MVMETSCVLSSSACIQMICLVMQTSFVLSLSACNQICVGRRDRARETKERLEKAAKAKAEEEAAAAKMRHAKTEYK